jgi:hypothetical protein
MRNPQSLKELLEVAYHMTASVSKISVVDLSYKDSLIKIACQCTPPFSEIPLSAKIDALGILLWRQPTCAERDSIHTLYDLVAFAAKGHGLMPHPDDLKDIMFAYEQLVLLKNGRKPERS